MSATEHWAPWTPQELAKRVKAGVEPYKKIPGIMKSGPAYLQLVADYVEAVVNAKRDGKVTNIILNDKCAAGTGRFMEVTAEALKVPLWEVGEHSLKSTKTIAFNTVCPVFVKNEAVALMRQGVSKADILAGLHEVISRRVVSLLKRVGIEGKFVITGGIGKNVGVVTRIGEKIGGIQINIPAEPQIAGALGAALFAFDRATDPVPGIWQRCA